MHDILEGVLQYQCKELMKAINQDEKLMSLDVLNQHLKKLVFGWFLGCRNFVAFRCFD